ncbi:hypothetical protein [Wukongibacter sp. M2B1]|uniref:hypothetical protein n=1 Tax=Wukongibacter sp. M2B1 TaxID=3088895 RepID=UPI003D78B497
MKKVISLVCVVVVLFSTFSCSFAESQTVLETKKDNSTFSLDFEFDKEDIEEALKSNNGKIEIDKNQLLKKSLMKNRNLKVVEKFLINEDIIIDIKDNENSEEFLKARKKAIKNENGQEPILTSLKTSIHFFNKTGEKLTESDVKNLSNSLALKSSGYDDENEYKYMTISIYVYDVWNTSETEKKNIITAKYDWPENFQGGWVDYPQSDFAEDVALVAWDRGPVSTSEKKANTDISVRYTSLNNKSIYKDDSDFSFHEDSTSKSVAYAIDEGFLKSGYSYSLRYIRITTSTSYYDPDKFGDDGFATAQYAHSRKDGVPTFSISYPSSISVSWSKVSSKDIAEVDVRIPRN